MKTAVIDVGGGLRGIFGAGVFDGCLDENIRFDLCLGVSAGSANCSSYLSGQKGRNYLFYKDYSTRPEYMSVQNLRENGNYIDMEYIYGVLSNSDGENPLDYGKIQANPADMITVCTNAATGKPAYFDKSWMDQDRYDVIKASCSIPVVNKPYLLNNIPFFDGALSDPVPLDKAFELGADKVVLILTKPADKKRTPYKDRVLSLMMKEYPFATKGLRHRIERYNASVEKARQLEKEGKVLIVSPDSVHGVSTLKRDPAGMDALYQDGVSQAAKIKEFLNGDPAENK